MSDSSLNLVSVKCPDCGAALSIEEGRKQAFCSYCGAKLLIENKNEYVIRKIDEAEVAKQEKEREIRLKEIEAEQEINKSKNKAGLIILGGFMLLLFLTLLMLYFL